ncbi:hypothetical protein L1987_14868 [Smallanthus sonchifolius]|uniref:Uncharacterized protein n=1 Tax=Smallanthus sonchifolius TaxID=185202 RepID=A0ACB9J699_9ASTR|nr:hypothetical protein L1987_14868 [Smallanthus sonchifolius]
MTDSDECSSSLSPRERRLLSNDLSGELNKSQSFSSWDVGESSSRPNVQNRDSRFRERQFDHQRGVGTSISHHSGSNHVPMDVVLNLEYGGNSSNDGGPGSADMEASSSGTCNEWFSSWDRSSAIVNSQESINPESSRSFFGQRLTVSSQRSTQQPPLMQVPGMPRNLLPFPLSGNLNIRNGTSSSSGFARDNRNLVQDSIERSSINGGHAHSTARNDTIRIPNLNSTTHDQQRLNDLPPWTLFPSSETESGGHRGHFGHFPSGPPFTSDENVLSSGGRSRPRHHQPFLRSLEIPDDEWQPLGADVEGRRLLVSEMRQILRALRRGENLRAEDYILFDPFINEIADLHDRHRYMRLDVDNMSYEELLALEERIGDVKTGLTEEVILKSMKQRKHFSFMVISTQNFEPCCICQEEYDNGDDIGSLDCGHDFHTCCIKQWLTLKNICPICKMTGLST